MGEKVRLFVTDIETTFTQGEFSPERIISLDAADTNLDVRCYGKFEFWGSQSAAAQGVPRIRNQNTFTSTNHL